MVLIHLRQILESPLFSKNFVIHVSQIEARPPAAEFNLRYKKVDFLVIWD